MGDQVYGNSPHSSEGIETRRHVATRILESIGALATIALGFHFAVRSMGTFFYPFDDEGYMLLSLSHYFGGEKLYSQVFTQYGPFYFYAQAAIFRLLNLPVTHDAGRMVTLGYWSVSALVGGWLIFKISQNRSFGATAALACFVLGSALGQEPSHPQQVVFLGLILASCISLWSASPSGVVSLTALGAIGAALLFTKINIGVFYLAGLAQTLLCILPPGRVRSVGLGLTFLYAVFAPPFLMRLYLFEWARWYCVLAIICGIAVFTLGMLSSPEDAEAMHKTRYIVWGFLPAAALIVIATLLQGMSLRTLLDGIVLNPLRHPSLFYSEWGFDTRHVVRAIVITCLIVALWMARARLSARSHWIGLVRCVAGVTVIMLLLIPATSKGWAAPLLGAALPFLPLALVRLPGQNLTPADWFARLFITNMAVTQFLQPYPVAGTQINIAAAPMLLWAFVCISDGCDELSYSMKRAYRLKSGVIWSRAFMLTFLAIAVICSLTVEMRLSRVLSLRYPYPSSSLKGSVTMHLPRAEAERYQLLADSVRANCDVLFGMPVMGSFNLWSGVRTPNGQNFSLWMKELDLQQQNEILDILRSNPQACVLYNADIVRFWRVSRQELLASPLALFILFEMRTAAVKDHYEIKTNLDREQPWIGAVGNGK